MLSFDIDSFPEFQKLLNRFKSVFEGLTLRNGGFYALIPHGDKLTEDSHSTASIVFRRCFVMVHVCFKWHSCWRTWKPACPHSVFCLHARSSWWAVSTWILMTGDVTCWSCRELTSSPAPHVSFMAEEDRKQLHTCFVMSDCLSTSVCVCLFLLFLSDQQKWSS